MENKVIELPAAIFQNRAQALVRLAHRYATNPESTALEPLWDLIKLCLEDGDDAALLAAMEEAETPADADDSEAGITSSTLLSLVQLLSNCRFADIDESALMDRNGERTPAPRMTVRLFVVPLTFVTARDEPAPIPDAIPHKARRKVLQAAYDEGLAGGLDCVWLSRTLYTQNALQALTPSRQYRWLEEAHDELVGVAGNYFERPVGRDSIDRLPDCFPSLDLLPGAPAAPLQPGEMGLRYLAGVVVHPFDSTPPMVAPIQSSEEAERWRATLARAVGEAGDITVTADWGGMPALAIEFAYRLLQDNALEHAVAYGLKREGVSPGEVTVCLSLHAADPEAVREMVRIREVRVAGYSAGRRIFSYVYHVKMTPEGEDLMTGLELSLVEGELQHFGLGAIHAWAFLLPATGCPCCGNPRYALPPEGVPDLGKPPVLEH